MRVRINQRSLLGALAFLFAAAAFGAEPVRIMPMGASITEGGYNEHGQWRMGPGYRGFLYESLTGRGHSVDFVGSVRSYPYGPDPDNEGHSGWRIDQFTPNIPTWLDQAKPDLILLMVGTNDIVQNFDLDRAGERFAALLTAIHTSSPKTEVIAASIIPINGIRFDPWARAYNKKLPGVVERLRGQGMKVTFFDMYYESGITYADLGDGVHPTPRGYRKIADAWDRPVTHWLESHGL